MNSPNQHLPSVELFNLTANLKDMYTAASLPIPQAPGPDPNAWNLGTQTQNSAYLSTLDPGLRASTADQLLASKQINAVTAEQTERKLIFCQKVKVAKMQPKRFYFKANSNNFESEMVLQNIKKQKREIESERK